MKTQKELTQILSKQVEKIGLAKEKVSTPVLRKPYYETGDKIGALEDAAAELRDKKLQDLVKKMFSVQTEIRNHINATYIWD